MKGETITQTEYVVRIVTPKSAPETNRRLGHEFTPTINRAIGRAIQKAAASALAHYIRSGRLDNSFRLGE